MRVLIVARSLVMQAGIEAMVTGADIQVVGCAASLDGVPQAATAPSPADLLILDGALLEALSPEAAIAALELLVPLYGVALLAEDIAAATPLLQAGVQGLLPRDITAEELITALEAIAAGLVVLHPEVTDGLQTVPEPVLLEAAPLTPREREVLHCLAGGMSNKAIARELMVSSHTVKFHVSSIFTKLGANSRTEAVAIAMRQGLIYL
ncbi:MAG: response regulator transcription factor [Cyanobacteria bacterium P01_A01_bin.135]